jgi:hypothetical protein
MPHADLHFALSAGRNAAASASRPGRGGGKCDLLRDRQADKVNAVEKP